MSASADQGAERRFTPTSGTALGWIGLVAGMVALVGLLVGDRTVVGLRISFGLAIFCLLAWCYLLRPRLVIRRAHVELRNAFSSWHVPLAEVRSVAVRAITHVYTEERRFDGIAVGRPARSLRRGVPAAPTETLGIPGLGGRRIRSPQSHQQPPARPTGRLDANGVADLVAEQILAAADEARESSPAPAPARRSWAWLEVAVLVVLVVGLGVTLLV